MPNRDPQAFDRFLARRRAWIAAGRPLTDEERRRAHDHAERATVEMGGPIPARFKDLQYLNKPRG